MNDALARLREMQAADLPVHGGRTLAYVYDSGLPDVDRIGREAVAAYAGSNGLDPTAFPSACCTMENDLVGFACDLLDAPADGGRHRDVRRHRVGACSPCRARATAGPTSSARRWCCPSTVHAAFHKAAHYFGVEAVVVPVGAGLPRRRGRDGRGDRRRAPCSWSARRRRTRTASSTRSPRSPPRPPRAGSAATSTPASAAGCCRTPPGWGAPCRRGRSRSRASRRSRSTRTSTPTPPRAPRCCCTATPALRRPQYFASRRLAGLHDAQPDDAVDEVGRAARRRLGGGAVARRRGLPARWPARCSRRWTGSSPASPTSPRCAVVVPPDSTLVALATDDSCDAFTVCDEMAARGWYVQPQMSFDGPAADDPPLGERGDARRTSTSSSPRSASRSRPPSAAGPVAVDAGVVAFIEALDPAALTDDDFDGLLAASGLVGRVGRRGARAARRGWPRSTRCSTWPPRRCARRCWWRSSTGSAAPVRSGREHARGLVDRGLVAPDWAEALAPVDDRIAAMGRFLREELAAGRAYLPAGDHVLRAFQRPLADVRVLVVGQDPYPTPGHPIGLSFAVARDVRPVPAQPGQHLPASSRPTSASSRRRTATSPPGPTRA